MTHRALAIREALERRAAVSDAELDQVFPEELRERSHLHWTPVAIAIRAAELLAPASSLRVLDVGAGVGKACIIGALVTGAMWWGVEQDQVLVACLARDPWAGWAHGEVLSQGGRGAVVRGYFLLRFCLPTGEDSGLTQCGLLAR